VTLSIVLPVLDEAGRLQTLLTDLAQGCPGADVVVADGGSRDGSAQIAARVPGVRVVPSERGRACQMNRGAEVAVGDVLLFLHADTRLPPGAASAVEQALRHPGVAYGRFDVVFDNPRPVFRMIAGLMNLRSRLTGICTGDQGIFVRRAAFERLGGYPEIPLMEDIELTRRLKRVGRLAPLAVRVTTSARRWERNGVARTIALMWTLRLLYFCGVGPERLHRWYYGTSPGDAARRADGSGPVVPHRAATRLAPTAPAARPLHPGPQEQGGHRQKKDDQGGHAEPVVGASAEEAHRGLLDDQADQNCAGPEQRSTSHGSPSSLHQGRSEVARPP
jgi:rSAM/selenodomain-associated transferase 2